MIRTALAVAISMVPAMVPTQGVDLSAAHARQQIEPAVCDDVVAETELERGSGGAMSAADLVRIRDIGAPVGGSRSTPLAISPEGRQVAFVITRADPERNTYCNALVTLDLSPPGRLRVIDVGEGSMVLASYVRGNRVVTGAPVVNTPAWSPDGRWLAYLRRSGGSTRAWRVSRDGRTSEPLTDVGTDMASVGWTAANRPIVSSYENQVEDAAGIEREGRSGYLYDARFVPNATNRPAISGPTALTYATIDPESHHLAPASAAEREASTGRFRATTRSTEVLLSEATDGSRAWTSPREPGRLFSPVDLWVQRPNRERIRCDHAACGGRLGIEELWWIGSRLLFLKREGWGDADLGLYEWKAGVAPRRLLSTPDLLIGCVVIDTDLLCTREGSYTPRHIVRIDTVTGSSRTIYDPNPGFRAMRRGAFRRLRWRNSAGFECFGDLVLPAGYAGDVPLPTIVVQYSTRGFLRGGVGDEYPIQPLAAQGFAVLSVQNPPPFYASLKRRPWRTWEEAEIENTRGWRERRSILSSLLKGLAAVERLGVSDLREVGITGLSDGATTVQFALVNAPGRFAAASVSTAFMDVNSVRTFGGTAFHDALLKYGYPRLDRDDPAFWKPFSIAMNAKRIDTPVLMQVADNEYLLALESYMALRSAGQPTELYVFPDEHHVKSQPAHRLAIYQRNIDWFRFWLMGKMQPFGRNDVRSARWRALRALQSHHAATAKARSP